MHSERTCLVVVLVGVLGVAGGCTGGDPEPSPTVITTSTAASTAAAPSPPDSSPPDSSPPENSAPGTSAAGSAGPADSASTSADDELGTPPPFPADTREDTETAVAGSGLVFRELRIGRQDGFDRVVWEFVGDGEPGWLARYEEAPAREGSGDPVDLPGDATLLVLIEGISIVEPPNPPDIESAADTQHVTEVFPGAWFEGYQDGFVGVDSERPFRVYRLADPPRVVLEVSD